MADAQHGYVISDEDKERYRVIGEMVFTDENMRIMTSDAPQETSHATRLHAAVVSGLDPESLTAIEKHMIATEYGRDWLKDLYG